MRKILVFNGYYYPARKYGGPATSLAHVIQALGDQYAFHVIARNHDVGDRNPFEDIHAGWNQVGQAQVLYLPDAEFSLVRYLEIIDELKPAIIWGCGMWSLNSAKLFRAAHRLGIATLMSPRGALNPLAVRYKWHKKIPFLLMVRALGFYRNSFFHVTGADEFYGATKYLGIDKSRIFQIPNLSVPAEVELDLPKEIGRIRIAYLSRISPTKNLLFALECLQKCRGEIQFDIYGPVEDRQYWEKCQTKIAEFPNRVEIRYKGIVSAEEVVGTFAHYHCAFLPTLTENYGHAIVEAMQAGCWVILSRNTTPWDKIDGEAGYVLPLDRPGQFVERIDALTEMDHAEYLSLRRKCLGFIQKELNSGELRSKYLEMFQKIQTESGQANESGFAQQ